MDIFSLHMNTKGVYIPYLLLSSVCMCSEGTVVILSVCISVYMSVSLSLCAQTHSQFIRSTNDTTYITHIIKGLNLCWFFSETASLQSQSPSSIVLLLRKSTIFPDKRMRILQHTSVHSLWSVFISITTYLFIYRSCRVQLGSHTL